MKRTRKLLVLHQLCLEARVATLTLDAQTMYCSFPVLNNFGKCQSPSIDCLCHLGSLIPILGEFHKLGLHIGTCRLHRKERRKQRVAAVAGWLRVSVTGTILAGSLPTTSWHHFARITARHLSQAHRFS